MEIYRFIEFTGGDKFRTRDSFFSQPLVPDGKAIKNCLRLKRLKDLSKHDWNKFSFFCIQIFITPFFNLLFYKQQTFFIISIFQGKWWLLVFNKHMLRYTTFKVGKVLKRLMALYGIDGILIVEMDTVRTNFSFRI